MNRKDEKLRRLIQVAQMYYVEDCKQSDIATAMGISRPLISRMLKEARDLGLVEININHPDGDSAHLLEQLQEKFGILGGALVADESNSDLTNRSLARAGLSMLDTLKTKRLGLGWGHLVGEMVTYLEELEVSPYHALTVCPLIGNAGIPVRHYQSSESVRVFAEKLGASPHFFNLPALPGDCVERDIFCSTESYRQISRQWERLDTAFVNIGNHPSTPDFASGARYGTLLQQNRACGRVVCYFVNRTGQIIPYDQDFALQIPLSALGECKNVVGLCSANTNAAALEGALGTGLFTHLVARRNLIKELE